VNAAEWAAGCHADGPRARSCDDLGKTDPRLSTRYEHWYSAGLMLANRDDVERYLEWSSRPFSKLEDVTLVTLAPRQPPAILRVQPPVLLIQVEIGKVEFESATQEAAFFRKLLELNSTDLLHASYGLDGSVVQLSAALEIGHLDENELEAALSDVTLALVNHVPVLWQMVTKKA